MNSYCRQCSIEQFGTVSRDLADRCSKEDTAEGLYAEALCEGCGPCLVDHNGRCMEHGSNIPKHLEGS